MIPWRGLSSSAAAILLFAVSVLSVAHCQTETATIRGTVADSTGAVIRETNVRLIDIDRGLRTEVATGSTGFYSFASVRPGHYRMEVEKSGFKLTRLTGIIVNVQDNLEENFKLDVGSASEAITVTANATNVNTTDGTVSTVVDRTFADNIPLNGRSFQTLIMLTPGVVMTQTAFDDQGQFSVNGQRADANYFMVDGVSANFGVNGFLAPFQAAGGGLPALSASGGTNSLVSVEAMQEFRVQTSSFAPEFGRTPGGQISIATRAGTNAFHGSLFEYFRNDVLDANDWFNGYTNNPPLPKAEERQNDFGGVFGGPIIKDKTFFFFSYEGLRLRLPSTLETIVPDTTSRQQAPATMQPFLNAYPVPNGPEVFASCTPSVGTCPPSGQTPTGLAQFNASYSNPSSLNAYSIRVDHTVNSRISLFGRYNYSPSSFDQRTNSLSSLPDLSTIQSFSYSIQTFTLGLTALLKPQVVNEFRANYSNDRVAEKYRLDTFGGAVPPPDSIVFPSGFSSSNSEFDFIISGAGEYLTGKSGVNEQRQLNFIDNLSMVKGPHQLKLGVDYRWLSPFVSPLNYYQLAEFQGMTTCSAQGCAVQAGNALSSTASYANVQAEQSATLLTHNLSLYGQDTWKVTPRLTLTYGLRWEINPPLKGKNSQNQPFTVNGLDNPATMTLAPRGTPLYDTTYENVAPRIGLAYQLRGRANWGAVLRGGFGIFYDLGYGSLGGTASYFPFRASSFPTASTSCPSNYAGICFPLTSANAAPPVITTNPPYSQMLVADRPFDLPRTYEWNAALEQSLGRRQSFSLSYVGAVGRDLLRSTVLFHPNQDFRYVNVTSNSATSDYHALQAKFERRLSQGLQALASYTWSHSIDIASTDAVANYVNTPSFIGNPNIDRGNSDFDIRHSFSAGVTYTLPTPGLNNVARAALGGWSVDSFIFARSAPPVDVIGGYSFAERTILRPRPDVVPGVPLELYGSQYPGGKIFNEAAFTAAPAGQQGDFGRNVLRGFGGAQADIGIQRQFHLTERMQLRFRGEFFNIFNHPNFGPPNNDLSQPQCLPPAQTVGFGCSTQMLASSLGPGGANGGLNPLHQIGGPRSIQLALRLQF